MTNYDPAALKMAADYLRDHGKPYGRAEDQLRRAAAEAEARLMFADYVGRRLKSDMATGIDDVPLGELAIQLLEEKYDLQEKEKAVAALDDDEVPF